MSFLLGSFAGGLFGGASSVLSMYNMYQGIQQTDRNLAAGDALGEARKEEDALLKAGKVGKGKTPDLMVPNADTETPPAPALGPVVAPGDVKMPASIKKDAEPGPALDTEVRSRVERLATGQQYGPPASAAGAPIAPVTPDPARQEMTPTQMYGGAGPNSPAAMTPTQMYGGANPNPALGPPASAQGSGLPVDPRTPLRTGYSPDMAATPTPPEPVPPAQSTAPQATTNRPVGGSLTGAPEQPVRYPPGVNNSPASRAARAAEPAPEPAPAPTPALATTPPAPVTPAATPTPVTPPAPVAGEPAQPRPLAPQGALTISDAQPAATPSRGVGGTIADVLNAFNPIGSAQAAEPRALTPQQEQRTGGEQAYQPLDQQPNALASGAANAANPQQVTAEQAQQQPVQGGSPTDVTVPASTAAVAPGQAGPTLQSQPTPRLIKPPIPGQYYTALAEKAPAWRQAVDQIAQEEDVTPQRLAAHAFIESKFDIHVRDGADGEIGLMQLMPGTIKQVDPQGTLDPRKPLDNLRLGARVINMLDRDPNLGRDTMASVLAYQGGAGTAYAVARDPAGAERSHPRGMGYLRRFFGENAKVGPENFGEVSNNHPRAHAMVQAAKQGPDSFINYIASTGTSGMQMSDKWRTAETAMMVAAASRGDYAGVAHARDLVFQMSHQGTMEHLMRADQALAMGDGATAAQEMGAAANFFPDGAIGRFGLDKSGNVWASRVDEHDPSRVLGKPIQITREGLRGMLAASADPRDYNKQVMEQQKQVAALRLNDANVANILDQPASRERTREQSAANNAVTRQQSGANAQTQAAATVEAAKVRAGASSGGALEKSAEARGKIADKEAGDLYGPDAKDDVTNEPIPASKRALMSQTYHDLRTNQQGQPGPQTSAHADMVARGIADKTLGMIRGADGRYKVYDKKDPQQLALSYLSPNVGARYEALGKKDAPTPAATPVGSRPSPGQSSGSPRPAPQQPAQMAR